MKRTLVALLGGLLLSVQLAGCAGLIDLDTSSTGGETATEVVTAPEGTRTEVAANAELPVSFEKQGALERVIFGANLAPGSITAFTLSNPPRVVVDIVRQSAKTSSSQEYALGGDVLTKLKVGTHPGKTRIVIHTSTEASDCKAQLVDGKAVVAYAPDRAVAEQFATNGITERTKVGESADQAQSPSQGEVASVESTTSTVSTSTITGATSIAGGVALTDLSIAASSPTESAIVAALSAPAEFTFRRTAPTEYTLLMPGVRSELKHEKVLAPSANSPIRAARAVAAEEGTAIKVMTSASSVLVARAQGAHIVMSPAPLDTEEVRAQSKPAAKSEGKSDEAAPSTSPTEESVAALLEEKPKYAGRQISLDLQDTDIDNALRIIAEVSNLNIIASDDVKGKITLRLNDVPWDQALDVILKTNGLDKVQEGNVVRIAPVDKLRQEREALKQAMLAEQELEPLSVEYIRVSYARAGELKPMVESVVSERGSVTYDERTNQLIVKDIRSGIKNVAKLVAKLDLRTPQILLDTQIVEVTKNFFRTLGAEVDFDIIRSPATGNATNYNFPNSIRIGGGGANTGGNASVFPAQITANGGSAISFLLGSADGTKNISALLSALETEGEAKVISRPSVATTNNKQATIKSVQKIRIRLPNGGLSVATGQGAAANGAGTAATEVVEVGIVLEVTPQASPDYYVLLDINAKSSSLGPASAGADDIPPEIERSATSTVLVSSGQTFAMGGIYKVDERSEISGIPFLKDIPFLGTFFRRINVSDNDEELMFFITPRIIEGSFDDAAMTAGGA